MCSLFFFFLSFLLFFCMLVSLFVPVQLPLESVGPDVGHFSLPFHGCSESRVDKGTIFKEREGGNDWGLSKLDKFPTNTPSFTAPTVQRARGGAVWKGKGSFRAFIEKDISHKSGARVQLLKVFNMHRVFSPSGDNQIPPH